jgi:D-ribose pyranase
MLKTGILNPHVLALLARVRHTNTLVIADRGFPYWPQIETVDISLVDNIPTVQQVLAALRGNFQLGAAFMAEEFLRENGAAAQQAYARLLAPVQITFEPHIALKTRVPAAIGLIRTADTTQFGNIVLESA